MSTKIGTVPFHYPKCEGGHLHTGELLNMVCVDARCEYRGLICPVCKMQTHEEHTVLPLKSFLQQTHSILQHSSTSLPSFYHHLCEIESIRKAALGVIREQAQLLANVFLDLEIKIEDYYVSLRKSIIAQSGKQTKLPNLIEYLSVEYSPDPIQLQRKVKQYSQLFTIEKDELKITRQPIKILEEHKDDVSKIREKLNEWHTTYKICADKIIERIKNVTSVVKTIAPPPVVEVYPIVDDMGYDSYAGAPNDEEE